MFGISESKYSDLSSCISLGKPIIDWHDKCEDKKYIFTNPCKHNDVIHPHVERTAIITTHYVLDKSFLCIIYCF